MASQSAIATVFDRASRYLRMACLPNGRTAAQTLEAMITLLKRIPPGLRRTLTWDQGNEMAYHATLSDRSGIDIFFADPHSPWILGWSTAKSRLRSSSGHGHLNSSG